MTAAVLTPTVRARAADPYSRALALGFKLSYCPDQDCYWLSYAHLAQPCPSLAAVALALEPGSP